MSEYDMNEFIDFLSEMSEKNGEDEDDIAYENRYKQLAIRLGDQHNTYMLNSFLHYLGSGTSKGLANEINKIAGIDDDKAMRCVETLIML